MSVALLVPVLAVGPLVGTVAALGCNGFPAFYHVGGNVETFNFTTVRGIKARLWSPERLTLCTGTPNAISSWVAIVPDPSSPFYGDGGHFILQVGIIKSDLETGGDARFFMARGGCNSSLPVAEYPFGTYTPTGWVQVEMYRRSVGGWLLSVLDESSGWSASMVVSATDPETSCWWNDPVEGQVAGEMKFAESSVGSSSGVFNVRNIYFRKSVEGQYLYPSQVVSGTQYAYPMSCDFVSDLPDTFGTNTFHCDDPGVQSLDIWTTH